VVDKPLTPEERDRALDVIVERVHRYRLETPTLFFLEMHRPLAGLAGLASFAVTPLFGAFFGLDNVERYAELIGDRDTLDRLVERLDAARETGEREKTRPEPEAPRPTPET
jgi:hypothetical protein